MRDGAGVGMEGCNKKNKKKKKRATNSGGRGPVEISCQYDSFSCANNILYIHGGNKPLIVDVNFTAVSGFAKPGIPDKETNKQTVKNKQKQNKKRALELSRLNI